MSFLTKREFRAFLNRYSLKHQAAASALGRSKRQIEHYLQDEQLPRMMALACIGYEARRKDATRFHTWNIDPANLSVKYENSYTWGGRVFNTSTVNVKTNFSSTGQPKKRIRKARTLSR
jgi:hypothetical protein